MSSALKVNLDQGSTEWLNWRNGRVCASDAPIIMMESPFGTPYTLWEQKMGLAKPKETTPRMQRGKDLESYVLEQVKQCLDEDLSPAVFQHKETGYGASVDGISSDLKVLCEIKCPGKLDHGQAKSGVVPKKYIGQLNHMLFVLGLDQVNYFSYYVDMDGEEDLVKLLYRRDDCYIGHMLEKESEFTLCMKEFCPPQLVDSDFKTRDDDKWLNLAIHYRQVSKDLSDLEKKKESIKNALIEECSNNSTKGAGICVSKCVRRGNVVYSNIPELEKVNLDKYRSGPTNFWRIT